MKHYLITLFSVLMLLFCLSAMPVSAAGQVNLYDNEGNFLSEEEYKKCCQRLQETADKTNMNIAIILAKKERSDTTIVSTAQTAYIELYGKKTDGLCYYMDLSGTSPCDHIATSGLAQFYYTNAPSLNRINAIFSAVDPYLYPVGSEDVSGALTEFANQLEYYYNAGIPEKYYLYDDEEHKFYHVENNQLIATTQRPYILWENVFVAVLIGFLIGGMAALITWFSVRSHYQFKTSISPTTYLNKKSVVYQQQTDTYLKTRTTKTRISSDSYSHSHHSHRSGHSHGGFGGGSHHR